MKLVHKYLSRPLVLEENKVNVVVIENPDMLTGMIDDMLNEIEEKNERYILSHDDSRIDISKHIELITDVFSLDINDKKFLNKLYADLKTEASNDKFYVKTMELNSMISAYLSDLTDLDGFSVMHEEDGDLSYIFKAFNLRFCDEAVGLCEKVAEYITVCNEFLKKDIFIFVNLKSFINDVEISELYEYAFYKKIHLILLENHCSNNVLTDEDVRIIDNDLCDVC